MREGNFGKGGVCLDIKVGISVHPFLGTRACKSGGGLVGKVTGGTFPLYSHVGTSQVCVQVLCACVYMCVKM